jgi:ketosteroid isomerase-like protein
VRYLSQFPMLIALFMITPAFGQSAPASSAPPIPASAASPDYRAIQQLEDDWLKAERNTDPAILDRVLSDDFVNLGPTGQAANKAQLLKNWQPHAGQPPAYAVETSDMHIYVLGDSAVAAYSKTYTAKENGNVIHEDTTHVFTKDHGAWKLRLSRSSFH